MRSKRILFVIAKQHFKIAGGIGNFYRGLVDYQEELDFYMDLCFDMNIDSDLEGAIFPDSPLPYTEHRKIFSFSDSINANMVVNFRDSIWKALQENTYTHIIANTPEAVIALQYLGIKDCEVLAYSHQESFTLDYPEYLRNNTFSPQYLQMIRNLDMVSVGVQTPHVKNCVNRFTKSVTHILPFLYPKNEMANNHVHILDRRGILFIGRWEERKRPKEFLKLIVGTGLPARVMTNEKGAKKFEQEFKRLGISDYVIKFNITGKEKIDFICESKVAFLPYKVETGPFTVFETMTRIPVIIPKNTSWNNNFDPFSPHQLDLDDSLPEKVKVIYDSEENQVDDIHAINQTSLGMWRSYLYVDRTHSIESIKNTFSDLIKENQYTLKELRDKCKIFSIENVHQTNRIAKCRDVNVKFTKTDTIFSTKDIINEGPDIINSIEDFFS